MPMEMQPKLLRVLEDRKVRPVGATRETSIDVRVLAATNRDLQREAQQGRFREDLYYRLNVIQIEMPPLRARAEDVMLLAEHFLERITAGDGEQTISGFSREAKQVMEGYRWPGNVRELENAVRRAVTLESGATIRPEHLPDAVRGGGDQAGDLAGEMRAALDAAVGGAGSAAAGAPQGAPLIPAEGLDLEQHLEAIRRTYMLRAMEEAGGVQKNAAARLGMSFRSFRYYLDKLGLRDEGSGAAGVD
jgi:two-component system response regulator PilR (NtrC family)